MSEFTIDESYTKKAVEDTLVNIYKNLPQIDGLVDLYFRGRARELAEKNWTDQDIYEFMTMESDYLIGQFSRVSNAAVEDALLLLRRKEEAK